ncbi:Ig-like domain-containing protein, partial [Lelliottia nimipressuralis]|uniref:Ig-like domain-containing protein n=1 Tax=Lelliottia nimipressuralis TaxID=69220 RepID=UPI001025B422
RILDSDMTLELDGSVADGVSRNRIVAIVTDFAGKPVAGQQVTFTTANGPDLTPVITLTGEDGKAMADMTSVKEGIYSVTATVNSASASKNVTFVKLKDIAVNGYNFPLDSGFPKTGFTGAQFAIELTHGKTSDYEWTSDTPWISVKEGVVSFINKGDKQKVSIVASPKKGEGKLIFTYALENWFVHNYANKMLWGDAYNYCSSIAATTLPERRQLSNGLDVRGVLGSLWSEWGDVLAYHQESGFAVGSFWAMETKGDYQHWNASLQTGNIGGADNDDVRYVACVQTL